LYSIDCASASRYSGRPPGHVGRQAQLVRQRGARQLERVRVERAPDARALGRRRAHRARRHAAEREARAQHRAAARVDVDRQTRRHDRDVVVAPLRLLERAHVRVRRAERRAHGDDDLVGPQRRLAVADEEVGGAHAPLAADRAQHKRGVERDPHRVQVRDRRRRRDVAAQRRARADRRAAEPVQLVGDRLDGGALVRRPPGRRALQKAPERRQVDAGADVQRAARAVAVAVGGVARAQLEQLGDVRRVDQQRIARALEALLDADLRVAGDQLRRRHEALARQQLRERARRVPLAAAAVQRQRRAGRRRLQPRGQRPASCGRARAPAAPQWRAQASAIGR
jgi:hypothetical protein